MFPICSIDVPSPCDRRPPTPLSLKLITANPIICAQQPAVAAPAASPSMPSMTHMATELMGRVRAHPTSTDTVIPMRNGLSVVARLIRAPSDSMKSLIGEQQYFASRPPMTIVTIGVMIMSTGVFFETSMPTSAPITTARYAPTGPPNWYPSAPVIADDILTSMSALRPYAMARPMQAPTRGDFADRASDMNVRKSSPGILAIWPMIRPRISEQNRPRAMWLRASTMYFLKNRFSMVQI